ncbi:MAG: zinc ribbon domain-containing protein, partial [Pyrinomonadaceae bacterium]
MYCIKCGEDNKDTAVYCRKCGESTGVEVETQVAARASDDLPPSERSVDASEYQAGEHEAEIFSITPTLMFVKIGYVLTAIAALFL